MGTLPPGATKASSSQSAGVDSNVGELVQYEDDGAVLLGVITATKRDKFSVLTIRGREVELARPRLYRLPSGTTVSGSTTATKVEALVGISDLIEKEAGTFNVEELWAFVHEERRLYSVSELCKSYFGSDTPVQHAGLRNALIREKIHFKRDKDGFEPRAPQVVEDLKSAESSKRAKTSLRDATMACVVERARDLTSPIPEAVLDNFVLMSEIAAGVTHTDPGRLKEGKDLVHHCAQALRISENSPIEKQAFEVLLKVGYFSKDSNLSFIRHDIPVVYDTATLQESEVLSVPDDIASFSDEERQLRLDLTQRRTFTIDDSSTQDMDDALSVERTEYGYELGIHITDVAWAVSAEGPVDATARRRATSLYCADQTVNMLPPVLSESKLSLRQGSLRPCLSVIAKFSNTFEMLDFTVAPTFIRVGQRYSYDDVDLLLEHEDETMMLLYHISVACEEQRIRKGAMRVHRREVVPFLEEDGSIRLLEIDEESPGRSLVAEMMVFANSCMARFAIDHKIPVIFRGQEAPDSNAREAAAGAPEGPAKDFTTRSKLKKSTMSFEPHHHAGLGLDAYIQATSPIRRYLDLCHQRQFLSFFKRGGPWIERPQFEPLAHDVEVHLNAANLASRETRRYWLLRYLQTRKRGEPLQGTVVRVDTKAPLVELDEVYITTFVKTTKPVRMGDRLALKVVSVDPHGDYVRLEQI